MTEVRGEIEQLAGAGPSVDRAHARSVFARFRDALSRGDADVADLAAEAVERMRETLPLDRRVRRPRRRSAGRWGRGRRRGARFEIPPATRSSARSAWCGDRSARTRRTSCAAIANVLATAMGRLRGEERMRHEALHDPLTGLANRALCRERLIHALARTGRDDGSALRAVHRPRRLQGASTTSTATRRATRC